MSFTRLAGRLAVLLLLPALPLSLGEASATPAGAALAAHTRAVDVDSDGDGVPDAGDGCPTVPSSTPTGCPSAARKASLRWLGGTHRLQVRVTSEVSACSSRARIVLWRVRRNHDFKQLGATVSYSGRARFRVPRGASYYVTVAPSYAAGVAECGRATSRTVRVPR